MMESGSSSNNGDEESESSWFKSGVMAFLVVFSIMVASTAVYIAFDGFDGTYQKVKDYEWKPIVVDEIEWSNLLG